MIYLIGYMGSGKSTVAECLSTEMNMAYIEMDNAIEKQEGLSIKDMFQAYGESYFRRKETDFLKGLNEDTIVSTGGGVILSDENRRLLSRGSVIYLKASWSTIIDRLNGDSMRPLWKGDTKEKQKHFENRLPLYEEAADYIVSVDGRTPQQVAEAIVQCLK